MIAYLIYFIYLIGLTTNLLASKWYNIPLYIKNEINPDDEELNEIPEEINISNEEETIIKEFIKKTNYKLSNQFYSRFDKSKLYPQNMCYKVIMTSSDYGKLYINKLFTKQSNFSITY